jgi:hypothetical protein
MKISFKYISMFALIMSIWSCQEDPVAAYEEDYAAFGSSATTIAESIIVSTADRVETKIGVQYNVVLTRSYTDVDEAKLVRFRLESEFETTTAFANAGDDASAAFDVSISGTNGVYSVEIPAGQVSISFYIRTKDDLEASGDKLIRLQITDAGDSNIGIGSFQRNNELTIRIADDDCPIAIADWVGTYTVVEGFTAGTNEGLTLAEAFNERYQVELALDPTDRTGTKVIWRNSTGFNAFFNNNTIMTFVTCPQQVQFDAGPPLLAEWNAFAFSQSSYNESKFEITCSGPFLNFGPYQFVLTKKK